MASSSKKVIYAALAGNSLIAITKFVAGFLTRSSAMLSEGIHSLVDTGNQGILLYGLKRAKKPADERFPFGHGKEIYFWSFVVAILIFAVGAGISIYEGVHAILQPADIRDPFINYIVLSLALLFEGGSLWVAFREFNKTKGQSGYFEAVHEGKDPTLFVVLFEDCAAMLGLLIALIGILLSQVTGIPHFDGIASICIGLILGITAIWLAYETKSLLIGESANLSTIEGIKKIALSYSEIEHINETLTMHMGPDFILLNLSVDFANDVPAAKIKSVISLLDEKIKTNYPRVKRIFVEAEARRNS